LAGARRLVIRPATRRLTVREALRSGAHLAVLSSLALAQPLFDILGKNAEFFAVRGSTSREIVVFALAVAFLPPLVLLLIEVTAGVVSRVLARALHLLFVAALTALIALQVVRRSEQVPAAVVIALAGAAALAVAVLYARTRFVPALLTALTPAPLVFLVLFLFVSPVWKLVNVEAVAVSAAAGRADTPVVLVVFDELSTVTLLDRRGRIDPVRYPNFAALASDAIWFRNATTVYAHTEVAVPAILSGTVPTTKRLPIYSDYPRNLFTLVGPRYRMNVLETLTRLCPPARCKGRAASFVAEGVPEAERTESLVSDAGIVYLHLLLPQSLTRRLPPLTDTWTNFRGRESAEEQERGACGRKICAFTARIQRSRQPSVSFLHSLLPHVPWQFLPAGRRYATDVRRIPGIEDAHWTDDEWLLEQGYQRYLLQLGYTDNAVGLIMRRLRATGLYDRALVIVTADHGAGFTPNEPRRLLTRANLHDLAFVPLIVKPPQQRTGRIDDSLARSVDILPTIADVLDLRSGWRFDGRSLLRGGLPRDGTVTVGGNPTGASASLSSLLQRRRAELAWQVSLFGDGSFDRVYRFGPNRGLIGKRVADFEVAPSGSARAEVNGASLLRAVDPDAELVPNYLTGSVTPRRSQPEALAIALNGEIAAVTRTYTEQGQTRFAAMLPPDALRAGANSLEVFAVRSAGGRTVLEPRARDSGSFTLAQREGGAVIEGPDGQSIRVKRGALEGAARASLRPETVLFGGWAVDVRARQAADFLVVFVGRSSVYTGSASNFAHAEVAKRFGVARGGFIFELPRSLVGPDMRRVRIFAVRAGVTSELPLTR
jgi:hypothetical protein